MGVGSCNEAENGAEALEQAAKVKPNLIILDLAMPVMNALQAAPLLPRMLPKRLGELRFLISLHLRWASGEGFTAPMREADTGLLSAPGKGSLKNRKLRGSSDLAPRLRH